MIRRLQARPEWGFFVALYQASPGYAVAWWGLLLLRGTLTALATLALGWLIGAVRAGEGLAWPLSAVGSTFGLQMMLAPLQIAVSANAGSRLAGWLYDQLTAACLGPRGIGHLESPELMKDLAMAREFDAATMGPPLDVSMFFIADGVLNLVIGFAAALLLLGYSWWAPLLLVAGWVATHVLLRESGVWKDRNTDGVRRAKRHAEYAYRLAVDASPAKEVRLFGLAGWVIDRFVANRRRLYDLQYEATRLRERPLVWCGLIVLAVNLFVFWSIGDAAADGRLSTARAVVFLQAAFGVSTLAFGGLTWALDGAAAPVAAMKRLQAAIEPAGQLDSGSLPADGMPSQAITFRRVTFQYPAGGRTVLDGFDLTIPAGTSLAIVGQNGAGKTTLAKLLCRMYDPQQGAIEIDGVDLRTLDVTAWRRRVTAVFQDFVRFELPMRVNAAPGGAPDDVIAAALADAGGSRLPGLDVPLAKGYSGGTDLSGGQWQRVALARALTAVRQGAGLVLLDEPTAQLDVRGEAEIFERVLEATRGRTTIIVSHRFSTVRQADRICVIEHGAVIELGTHAELMALGGRYRTMFDLQASRFVELDDEGKEVVHHTL